MQESGGVWIVEDFTVRGQKGLGWSSTQPLVLTFSLSSWVRAEFGWQWDFIYFWEAYILAFQVGIQVINYQVPQYIVPLPVQSDASVWVTKLIIICTFVLVKVKLENLQQLIQFYTTPIMRSTRSISEWIIVSQHTPWVEISFRSLSSNWKLL